MVKKVTLAVLMCSWFVITAMAQDLNARVQVLSPLVQNTNKRALEVLQKAISDFLNNRQWSDKKLKPQESIDCSFVINITSWDGSTNFKAEAQIVSTRPVYNTSYNSPVLNMADKEFDFEYTEGSPMDYSDQQYTNNLTSLLAYYAYIIVGMDSDTFSPEGGTFYYNRAQTVVNNAQNSNNTGWKSIESMRNRFWLVSNLLDQKYKPLRDFMYSFYANCLDKMVDSPNSARRSILDLLPSLQNVDRFGQGAMFNQVFFTAKADEFIGLTGGMAPPDRMKALNILSQADPANANKYETIRNQ
ncbi:protein of unknown function [bacterium A37T11]|nr:protein of unknown function [bacterium A37T11]